MTPRRAQGRRGGASTAMLVVLLLGAGAGVFLWWRGAEARARAGRVDPDRVVVVEARDVIDAVTATGRVEPVARVIVMSRASGILKEILVEAGDAVEVGQVLAELDREQLQADLEEELANLVAAEARVESAKAALAEATVRADDPEVAYLRREVERLDGLLARGDVSQREYDEAARALANADFRVRLVEASLPGMRADVEEAQAGLQSAQAAVERARTSLREATIKSPIHGIVLTRDKEVGDGVSSILTAGGNATEILSLGDLSSMHVEARVDEVDLGRIRAGMPALVQVDAHRGTVIEGEVRRVAPAGSIDDNGIVTFEVDVAIEDDRGLLKPDMTAEARLVIARKDGVASLPQAALTLQEDGSWAADRVVGEGEDATVERVQVELGLSDGLMTEITSGLEVGDRVLLPPPRIPGAGR